LSPLVPLQWDYNKLELGVNKSPLAGFHG
jgi:hypothetical protein